MRKEIKDMSINELRKLRDQIESELDARALKDMGCGDYAAAQGDETWKRVREMGHED